MRTSTVWLSGALLLASGSAACTGGSESVDPPTVTAPEPSAPADPLATAGRSVVSVQVGQSGSAGVVMNADGHILTSATVVGDAGDEPIAIGFDGGRTGAATLVGTDSLTDLAVVKVDGVPELAPAAFADSEGIGVGDEVVVLEPVTGAPAGTGTVLATGRAAGAVGMVETDAVAGPGSAGRPVVNRAGQVVGIVMLASDQDGTERSLAIPSNLAGRVAEQLIAGGPVVHPYLGATVDAPPDGGGALVQEVAAGGPAAEAGLQPGDLIVQLGDRRVEGPGDVLYAVQSRRAGDPLVVLYIGEGIERDTRVTLGEVPSG
jgi:putative serine protease PepD